MFIPKAFLRSVASVSEMPEMAETGFFLSSSNSAELNSLSKIFPEYFENALIAWASKTYLFSAKSSTLVMPKASFREAASVSLIPLIAKTWVLRNSIRDFCSYSLSKDFKRNSLTLIFHRFQYPRNVIYLFWTTSCQTMMILIS